MERAEADEDILSGRDRSTWGAVKQVARVVPQAIPGNIVILRKAGEDGEQMGCRVVAERHFGMVERHREGDVGSARCPILTVVDIPGFVEGNLAFVVPCQ